MPYLLLQFFNTFVWITGMASGLHKVLPKQFSNKTGTDNQKPD